MNGKKWVVAAIFTVAVLFLAAVILSAVLVFRVADRLGGVEIFDGGQSGGNKDQSGGSVYTPNEESVVGEAPEGTQLALVLFDAGEFTTMLADSYAKTCAEAGVGTDITIVDSGDPLEVFDLCAMYMDSGVSAIATNCPDPALVEELSYMAQDYGIPFVSLDTAMGVQIISHVSLHINAFGTPTDFGWQMLVEMAARTDNAGTFATLSVMEFDPVLDAIEDNMDNSEFGKIQRVASAHGDGSMESCVEQAARLLSEYDLDAILCADPEASQAAAIMINEMGADVQLYGFGVPDQLEGIMPEGIVFYYNPQPMGRLTAWAMIGLLNDTIPTQPGDLFVLPNGEVHSLCEWDGAPTFSVNPQAIEGSGVHN